MNRQSNNPFYLVGTYLGVLAGLFLSLKNWHPFWWLPPLLGFNFENILVLDILGGALAGYVLHILFRIFNCGGVKNKKQK